MESWKTSIKALTVDVFGTVTDWYSTIVREGERLGCDKRIAVDWARALPRLGAAAMNPLWVACGAASCLGRK